MAYRNPRFMFAHALRDAADGSVVVEDDSAAPFPASRLYDGLIRSARQFEFGTAAANHYISVDTGASIPTYNRLIIPAGHDLGGVTYVIEDDDNAGFTSATSLGTADFPAGTALIDVSFTTSTQRYLRVRFVDSGDYQLSEVYFTKTRTLAGGPNDAHLDPAWIDQPVTNVNVTRMRSGEAYALQLGPNQQSIDYTFHRVSGADLTLFEDLLAQTGNGTEPFYLDRTSDSLPPLYVRLAAQMTFTQDRRAPNGPLGPSYEVHLVMNEEIA